jgi:hypothetical protein
MKSCKRGNPRRKPRKRQPAAPLAAPRLERARLTLHDSDPITGHEDTLYRLSYECYRGYTLYSTERGRCCIHGKQGCLRLRRKFVCFPTVEDAKNLIKRFRAEGYTSSDSMERYLPEWEYVCLNWREQQGTPTSSRSMQRVS